MKKFRILKFTLYFICFNSLLCQSQIIDTLVDVGNHKLHFTIKQGEGIPILFESGSGNDGTIWKDLLESIHIITGATLITYDRPGYGKSELNSNLPDNKKGLITYGIQDLEKGLKKLNYFGDVILVSHSYGGFYSAMYASRNPEKVKGIVLIDASLVSYTKTVLHKFVKRNTDAYLDRLKSLHKGVYYETLAFEETVNIMKDVVFPLSVQIIDLVAEYQPNMFDDTTDGQRRASIHKEFVQNNSNRTGITAYDSRHYIFFDNPTLVIQTIVQAYCNSTTQINKNEILTRSLQYAIESCNNTKKEEAEFRYSESANNSWGYSLLNNKEIEKALAVFKLNILFYPNSFNVYDSYGEALLIAGMGEKAIKMYQKSVDLNPENENGKKVLQELLKK